jgi:hypothetical protein
MNAPGSARVYPLTGRRFLALWRSPGHSSYLSRIRARKYGRTRTVGVAGAVFGLTAAIGLYTEPAGTHRSHWFDFGRRFGRYTFGAWRTVRRVPISTGFVWQGDRRIGIAVTLASHTMAFMQLATRREWNERQARKKGRHAL